MVYAINTKRCFLAARYKGARVQFFVVLYIPLLEDLSVSEFPRDL
jgi:hypothetical protein